MFPALSGRLHHVQLHLCEHKIINLTLNVNIGHLLHRYCVQEQAISKGIAPGAASWLFSSMGLGNFAGRLSFGLVCDAVTARTGEHNVVFVIIAGSLVNGLGG